MAVLTPTSIGPTSNHYWSAGTRTIRVQPIHWTSPPPPATTRHYPWCFEDPTGRLHAVHADHGIVYRRSHFSRPPFALTRQVTTNAPDIEPRLVVDFALRAHLVFYRSPNTLYCYSDDDGESWSVPTVMIEGGFHPTIARGDDGTLIIAGLINVPFLGRGMAIKRQYPGEAAPVGVAILFPQSLSGGFVTEYADDSFHIAQANDGQGSWLKHVLVNKTRGGAAEDATSLWVSYDDGKTDLRIG